MWPWHLTSNINSVHPLTMVKMSANIDKEAHNSVVTRSTQGRTHRTTAALLYPLRNALRGDNKNSVPVAKRSKASGWKARGRWFDSRWKHNFILNFSLVFHSSQLGGAHANEIKHEHSPVVYVVFDPGKFEKLKTTEIIIKLYIFEKLVKKQSF